MLGWHYCMLVLTHPHKPGSRHTVSETMINLPELNTFYVVAEWSTLRQSQILPRTYPRIRQGFDTHEVLKCILGIERDAGRLSANHVASFVGSDWVRSSSTQIIMESSLIVNDASLKECSAQAGLPWSLKPCVETLACENGVIFLLEVAQSLDSCLV